MTAQPTEHLSDEQFTQCVTGMPDRSAELHLAQCSRCRGEVAGFERSIEDFGVASAAWSQAMPRVAPRSLRKEAHRRVLFVRSAWAFAAVAVVAVSIPVLDGHRFEHTATGIQASQPVSDSAAQIEQDNQLMQNVYVALAPNDTSALEGYGVAAPTHSHLHPGAETRVQ